MLLNYIPVLIFVCAALLVLGLYRPSLADEREFSLRVARVLKKKEARQDNAGSPGLKGVIEAAVNYFSKLADATPLKKWVEKELTKADLPLRSEEFLIFSLSGIAALALLVLFVTSSLVLMFMAVVVTLPVPYLFIQRARANRITVFNAQIGDALVIIANSLRSGFSFLQAMDLVRKEMPNPIAREFGRAFQEISLGTPTEQALQNMSDRVGSDDLEMVVTAVLIQRQVGGNLAEVLDKIAHTIRERIRIKGEIKTLTAQGRISGLVIGLLPMALAVMLFVISPDYISLLFTTQTGLMLVGAALVAQATGFLVIRRIVDIKY